MAYTVRSILGKTRLHRPDLREAEIDYITQEIVRRICRMTMLAQNEITIDDINGPLTNIVLVDPNGNDINRVHLVKWQDTVIAQPALPTYTTSSGGLITGTVQYKLVGVNGMGWISLPSNSLTITGLSSNIVTLTMPSAPQSQNGFAYFDVYKSVDSGVTWKVANINVAALQTFVDNGNPSLFSNATLPTDATGDYRILGEGNFVQIDDSLPKPDSIFGVPNVYAYNALNGEIRLYPPPDYTQIGKRLKVTYSYIPVGEIDEIPLLPESEEAVYYGTLAEAYMLPGPGTNPQYAKDYEIKFNYEIANLKAVAIMGNSGRLTVQPNPLGGRRRVPYGAFSQPWPNTWGW
jgi:hypothetical protein